MSYDVRAELLAVLGHNATTLRALVRDLDQDLIRLQGTGSEKWSILEVVCHLADSEEMTLGDVQHMMEEDHPTIAEFDPDELAIRANYQGQSLSVALERFERARMKLVDRLRGLREDDWNRDGMFEGLGVLSVQGITTHMAMHDCVHLAQISRRISEQRS
jgi:hypothetical protein